MPLAGQAAPSHRLTAEPAVAAPHAHEYEGKIEDKTPDKQVKAPTVINDLPGQRVELYRLTHGGALPSEPYNEEHEQIMLAAHCNAYERGHSFGIVERRLFSEIYRLRAKLEQTPSATEEKIDKLTWQVRDTCARAEKAEGALRLAQSALRQWTDLYARLQNESGVVVSRRLDYNLPPANHLKALEAIEEHFKPSYVGEKK
jgi:hypothetical protein